MMSRTFLLLFFLMFVFGNAQSPPKTPYTSAENVLKNIIPNKNIDNWTLIYNVYARDQIIKTVGKELIKPAFEGFALSPHQDGYYYINYSTGGEISQITDLEALKKFIGAIDNGEEAAIAVLEKGYVIDFGFKDYTANYYEKNEFFIVDAGKVTSQECPLRKNHFELWVDKKTGTVTQEAELGVYFELYGKDCPNNPHYDALKEQMEEVKRKAEEQKKIQKQMTEKMQKRLRKLRRKD